MAGRRRALIFANAAYPDASGYAPLNAPPNDARSLEAILTDPQRGAFDVVTRLDDPTRGEMLRAAKDVLTEAGPDDVVLLYYSGHGDVDLDGSLFLVASDTEKGHLESTGVETETLSRMIQRAAVGRTVLILDCCHAGAFAIPGAKSGEDVLQTRLDDYARGSGTYMLMATPARDIASDGPPGGLSVLTRHVVEGLDGPADEDRDGTISVRELSRYLDRQMARHETQRFIESGLNRQGDVLLAYSGIDREAELIPQIRARLFDWRQQDAIASDVLSKSLAILESPKEALDAVDTARRKLLFDIVEKDVALGIFLQGWYYVSLRHGPPEDDSDTELRRPPPREQPSPTAVSPPRTTAEPEIRAEVAQGEPYLMPFSEMARLLWLARGIGAFAGTLVLVLALGTMGFGWVTALIMAAAAGAAAFWLAGEALFRSATRRASHRNASLLLALAADIALGLILLIASLMVSGFLEQWTSARIDFAEGLAVAIPGAIVLALGYHVARLYDEGVAVWAPRFAITAVTTLGVFALAMLF